MDKKKIVILTGAGISAESGLATFRSDNGLWANHKVEDVATIEGWHKNQKLVLDFYNQRRRELKTTYPNDAHKLLVDLEKKYDVTVITQNVDDLHERAGSTKIIHLHGELTKASDEYKHQVNDIGYEDINIGDKINDTQSRPWIVWFGEAVPEMENAITEVEKADIFIVIGTSLNVYPAASLLHYVKNEAEVILIDINQVRVNRPYKFINKKASEGVKELVDELMNIY